MYCISIESSVRGVFESGAIRRLFAHFRVQRILRRLSSADGLIDAHAYWMAGRYVLVTVWKDWAHQDHYEREIAGDEEALRDIRKVGLVPVRRQVSSRLPLRDDVARLLNDGVSLRPSKFEIKLARHIQPLPRAGMALVGEEMDRRGGHAGRSRQQLHDRAG
jgi:hypothetical protein